MAKKPALSPTERAFCIHYVRLRGNGTRAYMAAHPRANENTAAVQSHRLLEHPKIAQEIERLTTEALKRAQASADQVLAELSHLGFSDIGNCVWAPGERDSAGEPTVAGTLKPLHEMAPEVRRTIKKIGFDANGRPEVVMWADKPALTHLARHHKLLSDDAQVSRITLEVLIVESMKHEEKQQS